MQFTVYPFHPNFFTSAHYQKLSVGLGGLLPRRGSCCMMRPGAGGLLHRVLSTVQDLLRCLKSFFPRICQIHSQRKLNKKLNLNRKPLLFVWKTKNPSGFSFLNYSHFPTSAWSLETAPRPLEDFPVLRTSPSSSPPSPAPAPGAPASASRNGFGHLEDFVWFVSN